MTSSSPRRFPVGLTLAAAVVVAACVALGVWQAQRFQWKLGVLAHIAALSHAPAQPIGPVLARAQAGEDVSFTRVVADCRPSPANRLASYLSSTDQGEWAWEPTADCGLVGLQYDSIPVIRGVLDSSRGGTQPPTTPLPAPLRVLGVLERAGPNQLYSLGHPAPYILVAERETPPPPGVTPRPFVADTPGNLQYVGAYAPTWFGLAAVAACFYAAMLWRRYRP
jgi:surfeit locus 1 family protein